MDAIFRRAALLSLGTAFGLLVAAAASHNTAFALVGAASSAIAIGLISRYGLPS